MSRLVVALDPDAGISPADVVAAWECDEEARAMGSAAAGDSVSPEFLADAMALVVIPLVVNVASSVAYDMVRRLVAKIRPARPEEPGLEFIEVVNANGDRIVVVRLREARQ